MPYYVPRPEFLPTTQPSFPATTGDVFSASIGRTVTELPVPSILSAGQLGILEGLGKPIDYNSAKSRAEAAGVTLDNELYQDTTEQALDYRISRKSEENRRNTVMAMAPDSALLKTGTVLTSFAAQFADPINVASGFVPVVGEARAARMIANMGRYGGRAAVGAIEGTVGNALTEALVYPAQQYIGADYSMADSLTSIAMGAPFGAVLHAAPEAFRDVRRAFNKTKAAEITPVDLGDYTVPDIGEALDVPAVAAGRAMDAADQAWNDAADELRGLGIAVKDEPPANATQAANELRAAAERVDSPEMRESILERARQMDDRAIDEYVRDDMDTQLDRARQLQRGELKLPEDKLPMRPVLEELKRRGGVRIGSNLADELASIGVYPGAKKVPVGLFKKNGGLTDVDNIAFSEWKLSDSPPADETGLYVDPRYVKSAIVSEMGGNPIRPASTRAPLDEEVMLENLDRIGIDISSMSNREIKEAIRQIQAIEAQGVDEKIFAASGQTRQTALNAAVAQTIDGRPINVEPILQTDPRYGDTPPTPDELADMARPYNDEEGAAIDESVDSLLKEKQEDRGFDQAEEYAQIPFGKSTAADVASAVKSAFGKATEQLFEAAKLRVVQGIDRLPKGIDYPADTKGVKLPDGTVYLVADNIEASQVKGLVLHEAGVHLGMRSIMGDVKFNALLADVMASTDYRVLEARRQVPSDTPPQHIAEETLAYLVENAPEAGVVRTLISSIKAWAYGKFGLKFDIDEYTAREMAKGALKRVSKLGEGKSAEPFFSRATDDDKQSVIPGAERISDKQLAERKMAESLKAKKPQKEMDIGMFGDDAKQTVLFSRGGDFAELKKWSDSGKIINVEDATDYKFNGEDTVVIKAYHGTTDSEIDVFRPLTHFGTAEAAGQRSDSQLGVQRVIKQNKDAASNVMPVYIKVKKPARIEDNGGLHDATDLAEAVFNEDIITEKEFWDITRDNPSSIAKGQAAYDAIVKRDLVKLLESKGYDSFVYKNSVEDAGSDSFVIFRPTQVKSVFSKFDPANESIMFSRASKPDKYQPQLDLQLEKRVFDRALKDSEKYPAILRSAVKFANGADDTSLRLNLEESGVTPSMVTAVMQELKKQHVRVQNELRRQRKLMKAEDAISTDKSFDEIVAERTAKEIQEKILSAKREAAFNFVARERAKLIVRDYGSFADEGFLATLTGSSMLREGARSHVAAYQSAYLKEWANGIESALKKQGVFEQFTGRTLERDISRALEELDLKTPDFKGINADAVKIAKIMQKYQEATRITLNKLGAAIRYQPGYITRQSHDQLKIRAAGFEAWAKDARGWFDFNAMGVKPNGIDKVLRNIWQELSSGTYQIEMPTEMKNSDFRSGLNLAKKVSQSRSIVFKKGAWFDYNGKYGTRDVAAAYIRGIENSARVAGLMKMWGSNPEYNVGRAIDDMVEELRNAGDVDGANNLSNKRQKILNNLAVVDGSANIPGNIKGAQIASNIRLVQMMAKLGGAIWSSMTDIPLYAANMRYEGRGNMFKGMGEAIGGIAMGSNSGVRAEVLKRLDVTFDHFIAETMHRYTKGGGFSQNMSALARIYTKFNLQQGWTSRLQKASAYGFSNYLGDNAAKAFAALSPEMKRIFKIHSIDEAKWDVLRQATRTIEGKSYLVTDALDEIGDDVIAKYITAKGKTVSAESIRNARERIGNDFRAMVIDRAESAALSGDKRVDAAMTGGTKRGTVWGEAIRFVGQFKSFPAMMIERVLKREIYGRGYDSMGDYMRRGKGDMLGLANLLVSMTLAGYVSLTIKDAIKGKTPRPLDRGRTWTESMAQGGFFGLYGDYVLNEYDNYTGRSFAASVLGPTLGGTLNDIFALKTAIENGDKTAVRALKIIQGNLPGANLFYVKPAMDYLFMYSLMENMNPGYLSRMEANSVKNTGQEWLVRPSSIAR